MAILQFAFGGESDNVYLPHNLVPSQVVYPGSHDNDASLGWYHSAPEAVKDHFRRRYFRVSGEHAGWGPDTRLLRSPVQNGDHPITGPPLTWLRIQIQHP